MSKAAKNLPKTKKLIDSTAWNPFTQAKFIYEINKQAGTPISWSEAYRTAELAMLDDETSPQSAAPTNKV